MPIVASYRTTPLVVTLPAARLGVPNISHITAKKSTGIYHINYHFGTLGTTRPEETTRGDQKAKGEKMYSGVVCNVRHTRHSVFSCVKTNYNTPDDTLSSLLRAYLSIFARHRVPSRLAGGTERL